MGKLKDLFSRLPLSTAINLLLVLSTISIPLTANSAHTGLTILSITAILSVVYLVFKKKLTINILTLLYLTTVTLYTLSSLQSKNFLESFTNPEIPIFYLALISLYFVSTKQKPRLDHLMYIIVLMLSLSSLTQLLKEIILYIQPNFAFQIPSYDLTPQNWLYLALIAISTIFYLYPSKKWLIIAIAVLSLVPLRQLDQINLGLTLNDSYTYLVDQLKTPYSLLLGTGPSRFPVFFGQHYSGIENDLKAIPLYSQSLLATLIITLGIPTLLVTLSIYVYIYKKTTNNIDLDKNISQYIKTIYLITALASLFTPISINSIIVFHIIAIYITTYTKTSTFHLPSFLFRLPIPMPRKIQSALNNLLKIIIITPLLFVIYWQFRSLVADYYLHRYNIAANKSQPLIAYEAIRLSIRNYPYRSELHTQYSLVNLVLADRLTSEGINNEQDRSNILGLYQQAIREANTATTLEPNNYVYWKNLGIIYRELMSLASNSYTYAEAAYTSALKIAPQNPSLWLDLGVVYFKANLFDRSCQVTNKALELKPDWYQAHANLGLCYNKLAQYAKSKEHLETALSLTQPNTPEYQKISEQIRQLN